MKDSGDKPAFRDRKLGDEWVDWDGHSTPREHEIEEKPSTFMVLAVIAACLLVGLLAVGWYMMRPRVAQFNAVLPVVTEWLMAGCAVVLLVLVVAEACVLRKVGRSLFPYKWVERLFLFLLPKALWVGGRLGISRDRVGNSFIKVHNSVVTAQAGGVNVERLLMLLPRCLGKDARAEIMRRADVYEMSIVTAGGGEEARKAIGQNKPTLILAVACERDLLSGIKDVAEKVSVLAIPNKRPEGPCKNTCLQIEKLEEILKSIKVRKKGGGATESVLAT